MIIFIHDNCCYCYNESNGFYYYYYHQQYQDSNCDSLLIIIIIIIIIIIMIQGWCVCNAYFNLKVACRTCSVRQVSVRVCAQLQRRVSEGWFGLLLEVVLLLLSSDIKILYNMFCYKVYSHMLNIIVRIIPRTYFSSSNEL